MCQIHNEVTVFESFERYNQAYQHMQELKERITRSWKISTGEVGPTPKFFIEQSEFFDVHSKKQKTQQGE